MSESKGPYMLKETPGTRYYCSCHKSANMPYCDGSHQGTDSQPYKVEIEEEKSVAICGCGGSKNMPFCDGSHATM